MNLSFVSHNLQLIYKMRLLLSKQAYKQQRPNSNKNLSESLSLTVENVVNKKCKINNRKNILEKQISIFTIVQTESHIYSFKIQVQVDLLELLVIYKACPLKNGQLMTLNSKELRINFLQAFLSKPINSSQYTVRVDKDNGEIQIIKKMGYSKKLFNSASHLSKEVQFRVRQLIQVSQKLLPHILLHINESTKRTFELNQQRNKDIEKVKRHIYFSCHDLGLSQKASEYRYPKEETLKKREKIIKTLLGKVQRLGEPCQAVLYGLMHTVDITNNKQWRKQFESDQYFEHLLQIPLLKNTQNQNNYIYNQIQIESPQKALIQKLPNETNTNLKIIRAPITYSSQAKKSKKQTKRELFNKILLIKNPKSQHSKHRAKILHQKNIVKIFQFAATPYLFKYYNCNQNNFAHKSSLLMDFHPLSVTLLNYLSLRKESLSIQSKLSLLSHISNSIRFFAYYKVVHMDLSLNNILIVDGSLPKIIDFGQSYNKEVVQANPNIPYCPGYTIPYCPPQVFTQKDFTTSQDMYSFGVILFRVLMNTLPLSSSDEIIQLYKSKKYHEHFLFCAEKLNSKCQEQICFLLFQLINMCLRTEQDGRPLPIWSTIVLKEIIANLL